MEKINYAVGVICISIGIVLSTEVIAFAQEQNSGSQAKILRDLREKEKAKVDKEWEKAADTNKDGVVDRVEIRQWRQRSQDSNSSGESIPQESSAQGVTTMESAAGTSVVDNSQVNRPWEKAADDNRDGMVDRKEFKQWNQQGNNPPGLVGGPGQGPGGGQGGGRGKIKR